MRDCLKSVLAKVVVLAVLAGSSVNVTAQSAADYQKILQARSPAMVTIKFLLKIKAGGKESETEAVPEGRIRQGHHRNHAGAPERDREISSRQPHCRANLLGMTTRCRPRGVAS